MAGYEAFANTSNNIFNCQCETEEMNQPLRAFQSNFARQLHQNEEMRQTSTNNIDQRSNGNRV